MAACQVHRHRAYVPTDVHHVWPKGMGGPDIPENRVTICPDAHREIHEYLQLLVKKGGIVPWITRRRYGKKVRDLAELGYSRSKRGEM